MMTTYRPGSRLRRNVRGRLSLDRVRSWHESCRDARDIEADGVLSASEMLRLWGRWSYAVLPPLCVRARRGRS